MEWYNGILCISGTELIVSDENPDGLMPLNTFMSLKKRLQIKVLRRACRNTPSLIVYDSLPIKYRNLYEQQHGDPRKVASESSVLGRLKYDENAFVWYSTYLLSNGDTLPLDVAKRYANEASLLQSIKAITNISAAKHGAAGHRFKMGWDKIAEVIHSGEVQGKKGVVGLFPHKLPTNVLSLRRKYNKFIAEGYVSLIHAAYCNDNSVKVTPLIERLLLSIYAMQNKPFGATVHNIYTMFIEGKYEVFDKKSGELYDKAMFRDKDNKPLYLSEATVWNYINNALNRAVVDSKRNDSGYNMRVHRPHHHRRNDCFALSKVSMDDRDLPRKYDGGYVKAYYAYDVASGCVVGYSYSKTKDDALFLECLRSMLQNVWTNKLPMPGEVEVEHHIVNHFKEELDMMFPIVRWCKAGNSQEKHAEHFNRAKKYETEHKNHNGIGRWWAKSEAYLVKTKRDGADYVSKIYDYDRLVADDVADIMEYNNGLHKNQKKFKGMTRWDVLLEHINRDLAQPNDAIVYKCIGNLTKTTICNNQYVKVQYAKYQLPSPELIARLKPNDYNVQAYWLKDSNGEIKNIYLYQGDRYIGDCKRIDLYNTARIEWTDTDKTAYAEQSKFVSEFDSMIKQGAEELAKIGYMETDKITKATAAAAATPKAPPAIKKSKCDINQLINNYDSKATKSSALNNI